MAKKSLLDTPRQKDPTRSEFLAWALPRAKHLLSKENSDTPYRAEAALRMLRYDLDKEPEFNSSALYNMVDGMLWYFYDCVNEQVAIVENQAADPYDAERTLVAYMKFLKEMQGKKSPEYKRARNLRKAFYADVGYLLESLSKRI